MSSRRVAVAVGRTDHLSVTADMAPLCGLRIPAWSFYEVSVPLLQPLCRNCAGVLRRLNDLSGLGAA